MFLSFPPQPPSVLLIHTSCLALAAFQPLTLQRNPGLNLKCHPPCFSYWCLPTNDISFICILRLKLYSTIVLNSHTTTAVKHNFSQINYQHVTICAFPQPPCHLLVLKKGKLHQHNKMLGGGDYISFILQPEEEDVFALWSLALCSYTMPLHYCDWGEGQKLCQGQVQKRDQDHPLRGQPGSLDPRGPSGSRLTRVGRQTPQWKIFFSFPRKGSPAERPLHEIFIAIHHSWPWTPLGSQSPVIYKFARHPYPISPESTSCNPRFLLSSFAHFLPLKHISYKTCLLSDTADWLKSFHFKVGWASLFTDMGEF